MRLDPAELVAGGPRSAASGDPSRPGPTLRGGRCAVRRSREVDFWLYAEQALANRDGWEINR